MEELSEYEVKANEFLKDIHVTMEAEFIKCGFHFDGDTHARDIYKCRFKGVKRSFSVTFGQSVNKTFKPKNVWDTKKKRYVMAVKTAQDHGTPPTAYHVLTCLTKSDPGTFEDFCSVFGYDTDSRRAEKTYKSVVQEWAKVSEFFTEDEIEQLQEIQ